MNEYFFGVFAATAAGITFNLGMLIQKAAVRRGPPGGHFLRQMLRSPLWLAGSALQFLIGTPLNVLALALVGPAITPGLSSIGLVVMAVGAVRFEREALVQSDYLGIFAIMFGIALIGYSRLAVDMLLVDIYQPGFLFRVLVFSAVIAACTWVVFLLRTVAPAWRGVLYILSSSFLFTLTNLGLSVLIVFLSQPGLTSRVGAWVLLSLLVFGTTAAVSLLGTVEMQRAFRVGDVSRLVPIQQVPLQIFSLASYFAVFQLTPPGPDSLPLAFSAVILILLGSVLLARRGEYLRKY